MLEKDTFHTIIKELYSTIHQLAAQTSNSRRHFELSSIFNSKRARRAWVCTGVCAMRS